MKILKCTHPGCAKAYNRPARLAAHLRSHTNDRPYKCTHPDCDKSYIEEKHLKQHTKGSHTDERNYTCTVTDCGKSFLTSTRLRRHQAVHEGQDRFRCRDFPPCNQSFRKHQTLQRHIRSEHLHVSAFQCTQNDPESGAVCGAGFDTLATLKRHEDREHGELRFWCDECIRQLDEHGNPKQIGFPTAWLLQTHIKQVHANCVFCGLSCNGKAELDEHIEGYHSKQSLQERKNVACTWPDCGKIFTKKSNLYTHIRVAHEGMRFVCGEVDLSGTPDLVAWPRSEGCGEGFSAKAGLENHVRYIHLKHQRPQGPTTASRSDDQGGLTLLKELAGVGEKSRRTVPCTVFGCAQKFLHVSEREAHVQSQHSVEEAIHANLAEGPILSGTTVPRMYAGQQEGPSGAHEEPDGGILNWNGADEQADQAGMDMDRGFWYGTDPADPSQQTTPPNYARRLTDAEMRGFFEVGETLSALIDPALN